jgi:tetratricopeptide (TPR) repeat protein
MNTAAAIELTPDLVIEQGFEQAVVCHRGGRYPEAEGLYTAILVAQPQHADANHNLGVLKVAERQYEASLPYFEAAIKSDPTTALYWLSYIEAHLLANKVAEARVILEHVRRHGLDGPSVEALTQRAHA